ncbi:MAG: heme lyase CcmF/NrfE family subunit, partial [Candidatus Latescibacteria bacterium]|nr:heme lyase CcmF/NrfE family subunit [Candidatus Latescibacterota bacterium]
SKHLLQSAVNAANLFFLLLTLTSFTLIYAIVTHDFSIRYVHDHSDRSTPLFYLISALWAGQEGSLLFWGWLLSIFTVVALSLNRNRTPNLLPYTVAVLTATNTFFILLNLAVADPFAQFPDGFTPPDGHGMNPLLQHPAMVIHPPLLLAGYVGFTVPFAFALAALLTGHLGDTWIRTTRRWTILAWFFLGTGMLVGAKWAYVELGWGGYWAWDPVENASLIPWLTGTAFLHSVMIQEKKGMLKTWNIVLIVLTFLLCLFGTFLTRSGIISSVHAFGQSSLGPFFIAFLTGAALVSIIAILKRIDLLKSRDHLDAIASREAGFLLNNLILLGAAFAVLWGTIFPVVSEVLQDKKITVGPPFFNSIALPIGLLLLLLTGAGPLFAWRRTSLDSLKRNFVIPSVAALIVGFLLFFSGVHRSFPLIQWTLSAFVIFTIVAEFHRGVKARRSATGESSLRAFGRLCLKNRRRYGGYIVHLGIVLIFIGIAGTAFNRSVETELDPGGSLTIGDYTLIYRDISESIDDTKSTLTAHLAVYRDGRQFDMLTPEHRFYQRQQQTTTEVAIHSTLREDLYVVLAGQSQDGRRATFKVFVNPLVAWVWIGGIVLTLGTFFAVWPERERRYSARVERVGRKEHLSSRAWKIFCLSVHPVVDSLHILH